MQVQVGRLDERLRRVLGTTTAHYLRKFGQLVEAVGLTGSCARTLVLKPHSDIDVIVIVAGQNDAREVLWERDHTIDVFLYSEASLDHQLGERVNEFPVNLLSDAEITFDPHGVLDRLRGRARKVRQGPRVVRHERKADDNARYVLSKLWKTTDPTEFNYVAGLLAQSCFRGYVNVRELWPESMVRLCGQVASEDPICGKLSKELLMDGPREARLAAAESLVQLSFKRTETALSESQVRA